VIFLSPSSPFPRKLERERGRKSDKKGGKPSSDISFLFYKIIVAEIEGGGRGGGKAEKEKARPPLSPFLTSTAHRPQKERGEDRRERRKIAEHLHRFALCLPSSAPNQERGKEKKKKKGEKGKREGPGPPLFSHEL